LLTVKVGDCWSWITIVVEDIGPLMLIVLSSIV